MCKVKWYTNMDLSASFGINVTLVTCSTWKVSSLESRYHAAPYGNCCLAVIDGALTVCLCTQSSMFWADWDWIQQRHFEKIQPEGRFSNQELKCAADPVSAAVVCSWVCGSTELCSASGFRRAASKIRSQSFGASCYRWNIQVTCEVYSCHRWAQHKRHRWAQYGPVWNCPFSSGLRFHRGVCGTDGSVCISYVSSHRGKQPARKFNNKMVTSQISVSAVLLCFLSVCNPRKASNSARVVIAPFSQVFLSVPVRDGIFSLMSSRGRRALPNASAVLNSGLHTGLSVGGVTFQVSVSITRHWYASRTPIVCLDPV